MTVRAINNHIIFQFVDPVNTKGEFEEAVSEGGLFIKGGFDKSAKLPRWAKVLTVGKDCKLVTPGVTILLPALRWTEGVKHNDEFIWKTDESQVVGYQDGNKLVLINKYIRFTPNKEVVSKSASGLLIVSHTGDGTPSGQVVQIADDCEPELSNATIYYDSNNFFNTFKFEGEEYSFISEDGVIVFAPAEE
jgi:hypothetical protein